MRAEEGDHSFVDEVALGPLGEVDVVAMVEFVIDGVEVLLLLLLGDVHELVLVSGFGQDLVESDDVLLHKVGVSAVHKQWRQGIQVPCADVSQSVVFALSPALAEEELKDVV